MTLLQKIQRGAMTGLALAALVGLALPGAKAQEPKVVISQIYGGAASTSAVYSNDFIELYNSGSITVDLTGWSVQYASSSGSTWNNRTNLAGTIGPGRYYLIREGSGPAGATIPTPDASGSIPMSAIAGKVALVASTTALSGSNPTGGDIRDLVGYGVGTTGYEGTGPTPAPSVTTSVIRNCNNTDTNNNSVDFAVCNPPLPRNSSMSNPPLTITTHPSSQALCSTDLPASLSVAATGIPPISYQWYTGTPGSGTVITGATGSEYATSAAGSYYAKVSTACESQDSSAATLVVTSPTIGPGTVSPKALSATLSTTLTVTVIPGTSPVTGATAVVNATNAVPTTLANIGGNTWSGVVTVPMGATAGPGTIIVTASDDGTCPDATGNVAVTINGVPDQLTGGQGGAVHSSPANYNGVAYYGDDSGVFYGYTIATATALSGFPFDAKAQAGSGAKILGRPAIHIEGGTPYVYFVTSNGFLFKVNGTDGTQPWAGVQLLSTATSVSTTPAVFNTGDSVLPAQDFVFVGAGDGTNAYLYKVRASDGVLADTSIPLGTDTKSSPAVGAGSVYLGVTGGTDGILRLNPVDLEILTNLAAGKTVSGSPFISATTDISRPFPVAYVSADDGTIYAANATTGGLVPAFGGGGSVSLGTTLSSNLFVYKDVLYVGANDNKVYAVNSTTGAQSVFFDAGGVGQSIPDGVAVDPLGNGGLGNLVFGSTDHCFYQVPLANPSAYSVYTLGAIHGITTTPTVDLTGGKNLAGDSFGLVHIFPRF